MERVDQWVLKEHLWKMVVWQGVEFEVKLAHLRGSKVLEMVVRVMDTFLGLVFGDLQVPLAFAISLQVLMLMVLQWAQRWELAAAHLGKVPKIQARDIFFHRR